MGLLQFLRGRRRKAAPGAAVIAPPAPSTSAAPPIARPAGGYVVVDVETTGLVPTRDRVVEIAVVHTDHKGQIQDEWVTLLNPEGPVGASHVHGITSSDVRGAPRFRDILGELNSRLAGRAFVAHNAPFDLAFVASEYSRVGVRFPQVPYLCTLKASWTYLPDVARRRLADLCWVCGIPLPEAHSALGDARATAHLLAHYLGLPQSNLEPHHVGLPVAAARVPWPDLPAGPAQPVTRRSHGETPVAAPPGTLWRLLDGLPLATVVDEGAPATCEPYLEVLFHALEDGILTAKEAEDLTEVARVYALAREQVRATHEAFLMALAHRIVEDGKVTREERHELAYACDVLGFSGELPRKILDEATAARQADLAARGAPLPDSWAHGEPLRIGDGVAFTGCDPLERARLEGRAQAAGLRVTSSVSRKTALLVTDGVDPGTSKAVAARKHGTRIVTPELFAILVEHVQPPTGKDNPPVDVPAQPVRSATLQVADPVADPVDDPAVIRAWAREQGMAVGVRGRIPAAVVAAYRASTMATPVGARGSGRPRVRG